MDSEDIRTEISSRNEVKPSTNDYPTVSERAAPITEVVINNILDSNLQLTSEHILISGKYQCLLHT